VEKSEKSEKGEKRGKKGKKGENGGKSETSEREQNVVVFGNHKKNVYGSSCFKKFVASILSLA
jgi:hypothetical protein